MSPRSRLLLFLSLAGLILNALLLWWQLGDPSVSVAGCGGGGDCNDVLASRWSQVLRVPLPALGVIVYAVFAWAVIGKNAFVAAFCYTAIAGAALWLIIVQAVVLQRFCPWCMAAHAVGIMLAVIGFSSRGIFSRRGLGYGIAATCGLVLLQIYGPAPVTHRMESGGPVADIASDEIHAQGSGRKIAFDGGKKIYDTASLPRLGSADAKHVMVEYFDYQCAACRKMTGYLDALVEKHPEKISVLLLPVPLDRSCNHAVLEGSNDHPGSCELARIALAVWRTNPAEFPAIHSALLADPPPDRSASMAIAADRISSAKLDDALRDPWIDELIQANIADWVSLSLKTKQLPKLLIRDKRILHGLPSGEADFIRVMEQELGL
jgi:uncharacterized membrane protein